MSEHNHTGHDRHLAAQAYVHNLRAFQIHASVFAASMVLIVLVNLFTNLAAGIAAEWSAWWSAWAFIGWGIGLAVHGLVVRLNRPAPGGSTWEQRKIAELLAK